MGIFECLQVAGDARKWRGIHFATQYTLRFGRILAIRDDKTAAEVLTVADYEAMMEEVGTEGDASFPPLNDCMTKLLRKQSAAADMLVCMFTFCTGSIITGVRLSYQGRACDGMVLQTEILSHTMFACLSLKPRYDAAADQEPYASDDHRAQSC